jgi:hypothetical protein
MATFASPDWVAELDAALRTVSASGPPLRVRYRFPSGDGSGPSAGYDLVFGTGVRAEARSASGDDPATDGMPVVTVVQTWDTAREVAAGRLAAQQALLDGSITVSGPVTALLPWGDVLAEVDAAVAALRARTDR